MVNYSSINFFFFKSHFKHYNTINFNELLINFVRELKKLQA